MIDKDLEKLFQLAVDKLVDSSLRESVGGTNLAAEVAALPSAAIEDEVEKPAEEKSTLLSNLIREMTIPQKIKLAMFGNMTARTILLRDANRLVPLFVLENPRMTDNEVLDIARNTQVDESVLRAVGNNLQWMKTYAVKLALVQNPKAPIDIGLRWLKFIKDKDMSRLAKSKNIPQVISTQARKIIEKKENKAKE